jgi:hypothetical protein
MQLAAFFDSTSGDAATAPADVIVVVPGVTASIVVVPAPLQ